ncbi:MAG: Lrp/AsnC ligand binding domain-containing protein [Candidatus Thorarchaeota archaeon]
MIAIILIKTKAGRAFKACEAIQKIEGIVNVHVVTGPYDIIAIADSLNVSLQSILTSTHNVRGVERTETCLTISQ